MSPHEQLIKHDPENGHYGDCYRTCIAVILDLHPSEAPHAWSSVGSWEPESLYAWLEEQGIGRFALGWPGEGVELSNMLALTVGPNANVPAILSGVSGLGCNHSVVVMNGEIVCDPSGNGLVGPMDDGMWNLELLVIGHQWRGRSLEKIG